MFFIERNSFRGLQYYAILDGEPMDQGRWIFDPNQCPSMTKKQAHKVMSWLPAIDRRKSKIIDLSW